jgi:hypothetical protein
MTPVILCHIELLSYQLFFIEDLMMFYLSQQSGWWISGMVNVQ